MKKQHKKKPLFLYPHPKVKRALKIAAKKCDSSMSSLGTEIIIDWLIEGGYLEKVMVEIADLL